MLPRNLRVASGCCDHRTKTSRAVAAGRLLIFAAVLLFMQPNIFGASAQLNSADINALQALATNIPTLKFDPADAANACEKWQIPTTSRTLGVFCDSTNSYVSELRLGSTAVENVLGNNVGNVFGSLDFPELATFYNLTILEISSTSFSGCIPTVIYNQTSLKELILTSNYGWESCDISAYNFSAWPLRNLAVTGFNFTGGLPDSIGRIPTLQSLTIGGIYVPPTARRRAIDGLPPTNPVTIPDSWAQLRGNLKELSVSSLQLAGSLDLLLGPLNLTKLSIDSPLPTNKTFTISHMPNLEDLYLNGFGYDCPDATGMTSLRRVEIRPFGTVAIHTSFTKLPSLQSLHLVMPVIMHWKDDWNLPSLRSLLLTAARFSGSFPSSIANSTLLESLTLNGVRFFGELPDFSALTNLTEVTLRDCDGYNVTTGLSSLATIPNLQSFFFSPSSYDSSFTFVGTLKKLKSLTIEGSAASVPFPDLGQLVDLETLIIQSTTIVGAIPESFGGLTKLRRLDLLYNDKLNGTLPASFTNLTSLEQLTIQNSISLRGDFPPLSNFPNLTGFSVTAAGFDSFPDISGAASLTEILLHSLAHAQGPIPDFNPALAPPNLLKFTVAACPQMTGPLPVGLAGSTNLTVLSLSSVPVDGTIPAEWAQIKSLVSFSLDTTNISALPDWFGHPSVMPNLSSVKLSYNNFTAGLPPQILSMTQLTSLLVAGNSVPPGPLPDLSQLSSLQTLVVDEQYDGPLPAYLSSFSKLKDVDLAGNSFSGQIPADWASSFENLNFSNNLLDSPLPSFASGCSLKSLIAINATLRGPIPASLGNCANLNHLDFSNNKLNSFVPKEIISKLKLATLILENNFLSGMEYPGPTSGFRQYTFWPFPTSANLKRNNFTGPVTQDLMLTIMNYGTNWNWDGNRVECPRFEFLSLKWSKMFIEPQPRSSVGPTTSISMLNNYLCNGDALTTLACPDFRLAPPLTNISSSRQTFSWSPCARAPWSCAGAAPQRNAPCISPGIWFVPGTLIVVPTTTLNLSTSVIVGGNFSLPLTSTVRVSPGVEFFVEGCVSVAGNLIYDARNFTALDSNVSSVSISVIRFSGERTYCDNTAPNRFSAVVVESGQRGCNDLVAVDQVSNEGVNLILTLMASSRCSATSEPPSTMQDVTLLASVATVAAVVGAVVICLLVYIFRHRIIPSYSVHKKLQRRQFEKDRLGGL